MRAILTALFLSMSVAAVASPALAAGEDGRDLGGDEQFLAPSDRDTPQINVGVVAGSDAPQPAGQERYEKN